MMAAIGTASTPTIPARIRRYRTALRLGWRDALRHRARTILSILLVMLPIAAMVATVGITSSAPPTRSRALASIPDGVQAVITATAVNADTPFPQLPEGAAGTWMDDPSIRPASAESIGDILPQGDRLLAYWKSEQLIATTGTALEPGEQVKASEGAGADRDVDLSTATTATMTEAVADALPKLMPRLATGRAPADDTQIVIGAALAKRLDVTVGDTVTLVAPPFDGLMGANGRIGEVIADSQRAWTVSGITTDDDNRAWGLEGWLSAMVEADPTGVDGHYLVMGDQPVTWRQIRRLNTSQVFAVSRYVLTDGYPTADELYPAPIDPELLAQRMVTVVITLLLGVTLVLFLVTPAFTVSADQSRRMLGLVAASGGAPRDLRRVISSQGLAIGLIGGVAGTGFGFALAIAAAPYTGGMQGATHGEVLAGFPYAILPVAVLSAVVIGFAATFLPARTVARMNPVDALKDRPTKDRESATAAGPAHSRPVRMRRLRGTVARLAAWSGPLLIVLSVVCGVIGLRLDAPVPDGGADPGGMSSGINARTILLTATILSAIAGLVLLMRMFAGWCGVIGTRMGVGPRLALRDAAEHRGRFVPAACAVLVTVCIASYMTVLTGSTTESQHERTSQFVSGTGMLIATEVPVNNAFDRAVVRDAISRLAKSTPVTAHHPVYSEDYRRWHKSTDNGTSEETVRLNAEHGYRYATTLLPEDRDCDHDSPVDNPDTTRQDAASALFPGTPVTCVPIAESYSPAIDGVGSASAFFENSLILDGDAMRISGFPNADEAARTLDEGGVVVGNAGMIDDNGMVRVAVSASANPDADGATDATRVVKRRAVFVRGFQQLAMSPATARQLGITRLRYIGEYVQLASLSGQSPATSLTSAIATYAITQQVSAQVGQESPLSAIAGDGYLLPWLDHMALIPITLLGALALLATAISLLLARTQVQRDMATMHAVGASPRFLRRFGVTQAAVILLAAVPAGMVSGIALGYYHVAWNRMIAAGGDGYWLRTVPIWQLQVAIALGVTALGLLLAWCVTRPPRDLVRRYAD